MLKKNREGVSEIVGALMLTLIVVVAAGSFAVFISDKQQMAQEQELLDLQRSLESISITKIAPVNGTGTEWSHFNVTLASLHSDNSSITMISLNDHVLRNGTIWRVDRATGTYVESNYSYTDPLYMDAMEKLNIFINVSNNFFESSLSFLVNDYVKVDVFTGLLNTFSETFIPPTAIINMQVESYWDMEASNYTQVIVLDGSMSDHPGNGFILQWNWHVENSSDPSDSMDLSGRKVRVDFPNHNTDYHVNLTVCDNFGMLGTDSITYHNP
jgi:flagellin-like protein